MTDRQKQQSSLSFKIAEAMARAYARPRKKVKSKEVKDETVQRQAKR